jgi:hypothetical protein
VVIHVVKDTTDPGQIQKAVDQEEDRKHDIEHILSSERGRRWFYEIAYVRCHSTVSSHVPNCSDSTAFNEGARSVGESLIEEARSNCPNLLIQMLQENYFDL